MRTVAVLIIMLLPLVLSGCLDVGSVSSLMQREPIAVRSSPEAPDAAISSLASAADGSVGRVEYIDSAQHLLVASNKHPMTSERLSLIAVRATPDGTGSQLTIWAKSNMLLVSSQDVVDSLWNAYSKHATVQAAGE